MNFAHYTTLRNIARKLGLTRLLSIRQRMKANKAKQFYLEHKPSYADISLFDYHYKLHTQSPFEWSRANAVYDDQHILKSILEFVKAGDQVWDIGASLGAYTCLFAVKCGPSGKVIAFEPESESREMLINNLSLNKLENVVVYDVAIGHEPSVVKLYPSAAASAGTHRLNNSNTLTHEKFQEVAVITIDQLRANDQLSVPAVIKIDVEGWEENVLLGGRETIKQRECKAIMVEIHFSIFAEQKDNQRAQRIQLLLQQAGFVNQKWVDASHLLAYK